MEFYTKVEQRAHLSTNKRWYTWPEQHETEFSAKWTIFFAILSWHVFLVIDWTTLSTWANFLDPPDLQDNHLLATICSGFPQQRLKLKHIIHNDSYEIIMK